MTSSTMPTQTTEPTEPPAQGRRAGTDVAIVMTLVVLVSVLVMSIYNTWTASELLQTTVESQLRSVGESRVSRIEDGMESLGAIATSLASGPGVVDALSDLSKGFDSPTEPLTVGQVDELESAYRVGMTGVVPPGYDVPDVDAVFPASDRTQYLQYHYIAANPFEDRSSLDDPGDGSDYSKAHAVHHPTLRSVADSIGAGDMLLIDAATSSVVYSVEKNIDFATDLAAAPNNESALAEAVLDQLRFAAADEAVIVDFEPYLPAGLAPTAFLAVAIRDEGRVIGAAAFEIPNESLVAITTANMDWEGTGLGETGEVYIVGEDLLMRSDSRLWLENPDQYVDDVAAAGYDPAMITAIEAFDTTVLLQPVDTEAAAATLAGTEYVGVTRNYLDQDTLTVAEPLEIDGLQWIAVTEITRAEAYGPMRSHNVMLLIFALVLIPAVIAFAFFMSKQILRPIGPIVETAGRIGRGRLDTEIAVVSNDEFGNLASELDGVVSALQEQAASLKRAEAEATELLLTALPERLVGPFQSGDRDFAEAVRNATLIAITVDEPDVVQASDQEAIAEHTVAIFAGIADIARRYDIERVASTATQYLAVAGLSTDDDDAGRAVEYAVAVRDWLETAVQTSGISMTTHIGLSAGDVIAGVLGTDRVAFNVWGDPRRKASSLAAVAETSQILVDPVVASHVGDVWAVDPLLDLVNLDGSQLEGWRVVGRKSDLDTSTR